MEYLRNVSLYRSKFSDLFVHKNLHCLNFLLEKFVLESEIY